MYWLNTTRFSLFTREVVLLKTSETINLKVCRTRVLENQSKDGWLRNFRYSCSPPTDVSSTALIGFWTLIVESANLLTKNGKATTIVSKSKTRNLPHGTYLEFHGDFGRLTWYFGTDDVDGLRRTERLMLTVGQRVRFIPVVRFGWPSDASPITIPRTITLWCL